MRKNTEYGAGGMTPSQPKPTRIINHSLLTEFDPKLSLSIKGKKNSAFAEDSS